MKFTAAPFFRSDVGDGFREVPAVAVKILGIVLTLAVRMLFRFRQNEGTVLARSLAVAVRIFDTYLNHLGLIRRNLSFGDREAALAGLHLDAVIADAQTHRETKSLRQPIGCCGRIGINQHGNDGAGWHRSVESHLGTLSLNLRRIKAGTDLKRLVRLLAYTQLGRLSCIA